MHLLIIVHLDIRMFSEWTSLISSILSLYCRTSAPSQTAVYIGVICQSAVSFLLIFLLLFQSSLWCRGVRDRALVITCSPIVSFSLIHHTKGGVTAQSLWYTYLFMRDLYKVGGQVASSFVIMCQPLLLLLL